MTSSRKFTWTVTVLYASLVTFLATTHVLWRDEARALNIVTASDSLQDLFRNLQNEGHPALWYLVLYAGYKITGSTLVLKVSSLLAATASVFVFVDRAPFTRLQRAGFALGAISVQYALYCRSYVLALLFLVLFAALHRHRFEKPFAIAWVLALLANTHALVLVLAAILWGALVIESVVRRADLRGGRRQGLRIVLAHSFTALALLVSTLQLPPDRTTTATPLYTLDASTAVRAVISGFLHTGEIFAAAFGTTSGNFVLLVILALGVYLLRQPILSFVLALSTASLVVFSVIIYPIQGYQKNLLVILIVVLLWIDDETRPHRWTPPWLTRLIETLGSGKAAALSLLMLMQFSLAISHVNSHLTGDASSSRSLGRYLSGHEELRDAILVGEPGSWMESVHYYAPNVIYFPREGRYGTWTHFTTESRQTLSLEELLAIARRVQGERGKPVVIALGYRLVPEGPFEIRGFYGNRFVYSADSLAQWRAGTTLLESFRSSLGDENYDLYLVTPSSPTTF